jgi:hypothetical protein
MLSATLPAFQFDWLVGQGLFLHFPVVLALAESGSCQAFHSRGKKSAGTKRSSQERIREIRRDERRTLLPKTQDGLT